MTSTHKIIKTHTYTHTQLKAQAALKKMKLQDYMQYLADADKNKKEINLDDIQQSIADIICEEEMFDCEHCGTELTIFDTECGECGEDTRYELDKKYELEQINTIFELFVENKK